MGKQSRSADRAYRSGAKARLDRSYCGVSTTRQSCRADHTTCPGRERPEPAAHPGRKRIVRNAERPGRERPVCEAFRRPSCGRQCRKSPYSTQFKRRVRQDDPAAPRSEEIYFLDSRYAGIYFPDSFPRFIPSFLPSSFPPFAAGGAAAGDSRRAAELSKQSRNTQRRERDDAGRTCIE